MARLPRPLLTALCLAATLTAGITAWRLVDSPLRYDESDFGAQAKGILVYGVPKVPENGSFRYGMWHPPSYLYSLAAGGWLLGPRDWAFRTVGVVWFAGTAWLLWRVAGSLAVCLILLSPLVSQGVLYLDIDNTSLAFWLVLFAVVFVRAPHDHRARTMAVLTAIMTLALWSKLTTPYIMLMAVGVFQVLNRDWRGVLAAAVIGAVATGIFAGTYWLYCWATGYPWSFMFETTYFGRRDLYLSAGGRPLVRSLHAVWWNVVWFSPALTLLFALMTLDRMRAFLDTRRADAIDFWIVFSWACFGAYALWAGVMGKYTFPAALAAGTALALWLPDAIARIGLKSRRLIGVSVAALAVFQVFAVPPLQIKPPIAAAPLTLTSGLTDPRTLALLATFAAFGLFTALAAAATSGQLSGRIAAALLVCLMTAGTVEAFQVMLSPDDRSPYRPFRECCFERAVDLLNRTASPADTIIAPKDIGYYFHGPSYRLDAARYTSRGAMGTVELIRSRGIRYAVDSAANPIQDSDRIFREAGLAPIDRAGDFVIYGSAR